jgi:hypothetical protein
VAAKYIPGLARKGGVVSVMLDGKAASVAVVRPGKDRPRLELCAAVAFDEEALASPGAAGEAILSAIAGLKRPPKSLVVAVGAELTFERRITLPAMPVEETDAAVEFQADRVLPFPAGEMRVDYAVESVSRDGIQSVIVSAVTSETAAKIEAMAASAGLALVAIVAAPAALYAAVAAPDRAATDRPMAVVYRRREGLEIAVGTAGAAAMSRYARDNGTASNVTAELARTGMTAGIEASRGMLVLAPREMGQELSSRGASLEARPLEGAIEALVGSPCEDACTAPAIAAGVLYVSGAPLANFHVSSAVTRRREWKGFLRGRAMKYAAAAGAAVAVFVLVFGGYAVYTLVLESKADALAAKNAPLKAAIARAETARPWTTGKGALLDVLANVTEVFPNAGGAFVKSLTVGEAGKVALQGKVPNPQAAYDLVATLSKVKGMTNVKLDSGTTDSAGGYTFAVSFEVDNWRPKK